MKLKDIQPQFVKDKEIINNFLSNQRGFFFCLESISLPLLKSGAGGKILPALPAVEIYLL
jgi:hypothetical protein